MANARTDSRRIASRFARGLAGVLALLALLTLACEGGEQPAPPSPAATTTPSVTASPDATATPAPAATPEPVTPAATATATPAATVAPTATATPSPTPTPAPTPTPVPTPPAVTVTGPLLVFSERVGVEEETDEQQVVLHEVVAYDLGADRYWTAFEYRHVRPRVHGALREGFSAVQPAGTSLIVWSEGQVRRMSLSGEMQALLLEDDGIREIEVSPDGTKVAVMSGEPGTLLVLDAASGEELLRVESDNPLLGPLQDGGWQGRLAMGDWSTDGNAVSVTASNYTAVLRLDGGVRVLPEGVLVSLDLRYAIQFGEIIEWSFRTQHAPVWASLELLEVETGRVAWTVSNTDGIRPPPADPSDWVRLEGRVRAGLLERAGYSAFIVPYGSGGTWLLETATGELLSLSRGFEHLSGGQVRSTCGIDADPGPRSRACYVQYDGRVVWEGARGWTQYIGMIEPPDGLALRGGDLRGVVREGAPPPPPARDEMVGPLLAYEVRGDYEYVADGSGGVRSISTRHLVAYDESTGRNWLVVNYRGAASVQAAHGGLVGEIDQDLVWVSPDGQIELLYARWPNGFRVSPDGRKVAATFYGGSDGTAYLPDHLVVLDLPAGDRTLRLTANEMASPVGLDASASWGVTLPSGDGADAWTSDSAAVLVRLLEWSGEYGSAGVSHVTLTLGGAAHLDPCGSGAYSSHSCLSPDGRYIVRGRARGSEEYKAENWRSFDIRDFETDRVLRSVETAASLQEYHWEWASADQFAWSSGAWPNVFLFDVQRLDHEAERADVSVLDITTGEIEVMDSADYLARFHPPPRATTDCPENPGQPCKILLDGEVVGEGRWPRIIGFIELDE